MTAAPPGVLLGREIARQEADAARRFLLAFSQLVSVSRYHELENDAVLPLLAAVSGLTEEMCTGGRRIRVLMNSEQIFVNRRRIRMTGGCLSSLLALVRELDRRKTIGFEIERSLTSEDLSRFLRAFHGVKGKEEDPVECLRRALEGEGVRGIVLLVPGRESREDLDAMRRDAGERAALLYAKTVVILRETIRCWEHDDTRRFLGARAKRAIQEIISLAEHTPRPFLWLAHVKDEEDYLYTHSTNVALFSVLLGLRLGLPRNRVCELGLAALFHDLGRIALPGRLLTGQGSFDETEREAMARHPIHGVNLLLQVGTLNESLLRRIIVVFEMNIQANGYPRRHWPAGLHLFSRIVAVADAYDAMTTRRSYRPALTPDEAMRMLTVHAGKKYDPDLVRVFANVLGVFPLGTLVSMDTGEAGFVFHVDPYAPRRPIVKLVRSASGERLRDGEIADLGEKDEAGAFRRTITGMLSPEEEGVEVPDYLTEGAS